MEADDFEDTFLLDQYRDLYPGFESEARWKLRAHLTTAALRAREEGGLVRASREKPRRHPVAVPWSLGTFALAATLVIVAMSLTVPVPSLTNLLPRATSFGGGPGGGQVQTTTTAGPVATAAIHPRPHHPAANPRFVRSRVHAPGSGHFLPDLWRGRGPTCSGSCPSAHPEQARPATPTGLGPLGGPSTAA